MNSVIIFVFLCVFHSYFAIVDSQAAGATCGANNVCSDGLTCEGTVCKINAGGDCTSNAGNCKSGTTCDSNTCKINAGGDCTSNSGNCKSGTTCVGNICKINVGGDCTSNAGNCKSGTTCDSNTCKINVGGDCTSNSGNCKSGTTCDSNICKLNAGGDCSSSNSGYCKSGTTCETNVCTADNTYGGLCSITGTVDSCVTTGGDANAVCTSNKCTCKPGYTGSVGAKCSGAMALASSVFLVLAALLVKTHLE